METIEINLFYPLITLTVIIFIIIVGIVIIKIKDSSLFNNIFNRHVDEHIDTTNKFSLSHTEIVSGLPVIYHQEFHNLEKEIKNNKQYMFKINKKINILIEKIKKLENK